MTCRTIPALAILALIAACNDAPPSNEMVEAGTASNIPPPAGYPAAGQDPPAAPPNRPVPAGRGDGANDGYPVLSPPVLTAQAERGETGARNVLTSWARAIELGEFDQAWGMMSESDHRKWSKADFAAIFTGLRDITVAVPSGRMEGAAGSSFYTSHVEITAEDTDGRPVRIEGEMVLRRVNDVPGATPEQLRWHVESTTLDATH